MNERETVFKASRAYYAHRAYNYNLLAEQQGELFEITKREVDFVEQASTLMRLAQSERYFDVACESARHISALAKRGLSFSVSLFSFTNKALYNI